MMKATDAHGRRPERLALAMDAGGEHTDRTFAVRPCGDGWSVQSEDREALVFKTGAEAERGARRIAERLAGQGFEVTVQVFDARDVLVGAISYAPGEGGRDPEVSQTHMAGIGALVRAHDGSGDAPR